MSMSETDLESLLAEGKRLAASKPRASDLDRPSKVDTPMQDPLAHLADDPVRPAASGRATASLKATWLDPEETPFTPVPRPGSPLASRMLSLVVTAAFIAALAWLIVPEVGFRLLSQDTILIRDGVLSAQAVPLAPTRPAIVTDLYVDAGDLPDGVLPAGTPIAEITGLTIDGKRTEASDISVPFDARFVSVDTLVGAVTLPGTPVATIYDPSKMYIIITVNPDTLESLRHGMRVVLHSSSLPNDIGGTVISAVPLLGTDHDPTSAVLVNIRVKPDEGTAIDLVPGIRFDAEIDLNSVSPDAAPLVFTDSTHVETAEN